MTGICKPPFNTPLNRDHWAAQGLVASYLFNENSGRTVYDSSGNENHGTMIGFGAEDSANSGWAPGPHGGALAFDGIDDCISVPICASLGPDVSIIAGVQFSSAKLQEIYNARDIQLNVATYNYDFAIQATNKIASVIGIGGWGWSSYNSISSIPIGENISICETITPRRIRFGINGILESAINTSLMYSRPLTSGNLVDVGRFYISGYGDTAYLHGILNYLYLYSRALSPEEVAYLNFDPYVAYRWDEAIYSKPFNQNFYRQLLAGGY